MEVDMIKAPLPKNEAERLATLVEYQVLDTTPELAYDDITSIASSICETPIALVSLIDEKRQWFKSRHGIDAAETPREISFCGHAIQTNEVLVVPDSLLDERFADNPLVTGGPKVRFYAGAPLLAPNGHAMGTLCVIDEKARELKPEQIKSLEALARQVVAQLEMRKLHQTQKNNFEELQKYTKHIVEFQTQLTQSSKMAALGEMASGIAHEINNPLAIIQGKLYAVKTMIAEGEFAQDAVNRDFEKIETTVTRIAKIVKGLNLFSRKADQDEMVKAKVSQIIEATFDLCRERFHAQQIKLECDTLSDLEIECRPTQISQTLLNLLSNAFDAVIGLPEKWVKVSINHDSSVARIKVQDSGRGIPEATANKMMQPFFSTKEVGKGTGLGLSISLGIVQEHGGNLFLDQASKNTTLVIELPLVQPNPVKAI
jgi:two-component system NtrC family sensor kinase